VAQAFRPVPLDSYWGIIQSGARARLTTAQLWAAVRHSSELAGETLSPGAFQRMNQLRGLAGSQIRADSFLAGLNRSAAITAASIAQDINSRDALARSLSPRFKVAFDVEGTRISTGSAVTLRLTDTFGPTLPGTVGALEDDLGVSAPALAMDSDLELAQVTGNISIREV